MTQKLESTLWQEAAELCDQNHDLLILGSVGIAVTMGVALSTKPRGIPRDIDVLRVGNRAPVHAMGSAPIDFTFENWVAEDGSYLVYPPDQRLQVPIKFPEVFEPVSIIREGYSMSVPAPEVLDGLDRMMYITNGKNRRLRHDFHNYIGGSNTVLHPELLRPFEVLREALRWHVSYRVYGAARNLYHRTTPEHIRANLNLARFTTRLAAHVPE